MANGNSGVVNAIVVVAALGVLLYAAWCYNSSRRSETFSGPYAEHMTVTPGGGDIAKPNDPASEPYRPVDFQSVVSDVAPEDCFPRDRLSAEDLLPKDAANSQWAKVNPAGQGDISDQNFLASGHHQGIDTIGGTLRNANLQLRSEPPNPRQQVSPWLQSTIEPDLNRRPFEIDGSC
jgi:hypothetical protein